MIRTEHVEIEGRDFIRTYSDAGYMIHGGSPESDYAESYDPAEFNRTFVETDIPIEETDAEEIVEILTGGAE